VNEHRLRHNSFGVWLATTEQLEFRIQNNPNQSAAPILSRGLAALIFYESMTQILKNKIATTLVVLGLATAARAQVSLGFQVNSDWSAAAVSSLEALVKAA
jgi:nitrous oxidase accessory protein NosD